MLLILPLPNPSDNPVFRSIKYGSYTSTADAILILENMSPKIILDFQGSEADLLIVIKELILNKWQPIIKIDHKLDPDNIEQLKPEKR